jgi:hypothetical protein
VGEWVGAGAGGRNDPNNICTCEQMNLKKGVEERKEEKIKDQRREEWKK